MKAIILAADPEVVVTSDGNGLPRCLLPLNNKLTILERQIRTLNLHGVTQEDIVLVVGEQGPWARDSILEQALEIHPHIAINPRNAETGIAASLAVGLEMVGNQDDLLIIDGDLVFDSSILDCLLAVSDASVLLTRRALSITEQGSRVQVKDGKVVCAGRTIDFSNGFPWQIYSGIAYIQSEAIPLIRSHVHHHIHGDLLEIITDIAWDSDFVTVDHSRSISGENGVKERPVNLTGGSYAALTRRHVVRKEASGRGRQKLRYEIQWLVNLPEDLRSYFPKVCDYYDGDDLVWYEMPFYDRPNLRRLLMTGDYTASDACRFLKQVLDFMFKKVYIQGIRTTPSDWLINKHLNRAHRRLIHSLRRSKPLANLIEAQSIVLNGREFDNIPDLTLEIARRSTLLEALTPSKLRMIHGDLHFQNILVGPMENDAPFLLADPRGELNGSDLFYDMGKIWHSVNGMYDFLHTDQFELSVSSFSKGKNIEAKLALANQKAVQSYVAVREMLPHMLQEYDLIHNDPNWLMKTLFAEAMHFCTVMPFHLQGDGKDQRAIAMYLTGVKLLNVFGERFDIASWPEDSAYIHVNTQADYIRALGLITSRGVNGGSVEEE